MSSRFPNQRQSRISFRLIDKFFWKLQANLQVKREELKRKDEMIRNSSENNNLPYQGRIVHTADLFLKSYQFI